MPSIQARARFLHIAPRKLRIVADLVRGEPVASAATTLRFTPNRGAKVLDRVLRSAIANAEHNAALDAESLYVSRILVDEGPTLKRFQPRAMGRAGRIRKRTSHLTVEVATRKDRT